MPLGMEIGLSPGDFVLDEDPAPHVNCRPMFIIVSCRTRVKRLYACAQIHYLCFSNYRIWVKYSGNLVTLLTLFVLKKDCSMFKVTVTVTVVTSFKNIVAYRRSALNPV